MTRPYSCICFVSVYISVISGRPTFGTCRPVDPYLRKLVCSSLLLSHQPIALGSQGVCVAIFFFREFLQLLNIANKLSTIADQPTRCKYPYALLPAMRVIHRIAQPEIRAQWLEDGHTQVEARCPMVCWRGIWVVLRWLSITAFPISCLSSYLLNLLSVFKYWTWMSSDKFFRFE